MLTEFFIIGLIGGLLGIFYRNCLKVKNMIFNPIYKVLSRWVRDSRKELCYEPSLLAKFKGFIAYPLGYCIYCSTTWITFFLTAIYLWYIPTLPSLPYIILGVVTVMGVQHLVVCIACRWLIEGNPDLTDVIEEDEELD